MWRWCSLSVLLLPRLTHAADPTFDELHAEGVAANPTDIVLKVKIDQRPFELGEPIPARMTFSSPGQSDLQVDCLSARADMPWYEAWVADPPRADPLRDFGFGMVYSHHGLRRLSPIGITCTVDLNEWVRFEQPGHYRLFAVSGRVWGATVVSTSDVVDVEIVAARDPAGALARAVAMFDGGEREAGARLLAFLDTRDAVAAMVERYGVDARADGYLLQGLAGSRWRREVIDAMEARLDRDPPVEVWWIRRLGGIQATELAEVLRLQSTYGRRLLAHPPGRSASDRVRAVLVAARFVREPAVVGPPVAEVFGTLPVDDKRALLQTWWWHIRGPWMAPVLAAEWDGATPELRAWVLRRAFDVDPAWARARIIEVVRDGVPWISDLHEHGFWSLLAPDPLEVLELLEDETLPRLEPALCAAVLRDDAFAMRMLSRYGSAGALTCVHQADDAGMLRGADGRGWLIAYALRVEPAWGRELLARTLATPDGDLEQILGRIVRHVVTPEVQEGLARCAEAGGCIALLGAYGAPSAREVLWRALAAPAGPEQEERRLAAALIEGVGWTFDATDRERLAALVETDRGRDLVDQMEGRVVQPTLYLDDTAGREVTAHVMGVGVWSWEQVERRLALLPPGTEVRWSSRGAFGWERSAAIARRHGLVLQRE